MNDLADDAVVGIDDNLLIARDTESKGWEDELEVGHLDPYEDDDD